MASRQMADQEMAGEKAEAVGEQAMGPAAIAAAASVGLSWYYFFLRGEKEHGIFVGLWPPTFLAFASYFNQRKMRQKIDMMSEPGTSLRTALDSMMGNK